MKGHARLILEYVAFVLRRNFRPHSLELPKIHKGWFQDTLPSSLPDKICFAHLDGDLYDSQ